MNKERVVDYIIKCDGEFHKAFSTLGEARKYIKDLPIKVGIANMPKEVQLIKKIEINETLNTYSLKTKVVLEAARTFDDIDLA